MKKKCLDKSTSKMWKRIGHNAHQGMQRDLSIEKVTRISKINFPPKKRKSIS